jgi:hypothetical protein
MIKVERITIAIFTKLLAIRIVANNLFGLDNKSKTLVETLSLLLFKVSLSFASIEKKATSEPETKAESTRRTIITIIAIIIENDIGLNTKRSPERDSILEGSN